MPFQIVPNGIEIAMRYTLESQQVANVFHVHEDNASEPTALIDVAQDVEAWWRQNIRPMQHRQLTLNEIVTTYLGEEDGIQYALSPAEPRGGDHPGVAMPANVTLAISLRTGRRGRSYRGRLYHLGLTEDRVQASFVDPAHVVELVDAYDSLRIALGSVAGRYLAVLSRWENGVIRPTGVLTEVASVTVTDGVVDSQRRRLPGRGR